MENEIVALVPVKGKSERIPKKNIRSFGNTNLLELKLKQLKKAEGFFDIIVSSEDGEILDTAHKYGYSVHVRDPKYSTSRVPMSEVYSYIASEISGENIAWINVTNPLADRDVYSKAIEKYKKMPEEKDCLLSVYKLQDNFFYRGKPLNFVPYPWARSQDLEGVYCMSFVINILKREDMIRWGSCVGNNPEFYEIDQLTSWDIDFQIDFDFCEFVYKKTVL